MSLTEQLSRFIPGFSRAGAEPNVVADLIPETVADTKNDPRTRLLNRVNGWAAGGMLAAQLLTPATAYAENPNASQTESPSVAPTTSQVFETGYASNYLEASDQSLNQSEELKPNERLRVSGLVFRSQRALAQWWNHKPIDPGQILGKGKNLECQFLGYKYELVFNSKGIQQTVVRMRCLGRNTTGWQEGYALLSQVSGLKSRKVSEAEDTPSIAEILAKQNISPVRPNNDQGRFAGPLKDEKPNGKYTPTGPIDRIG